MKGGGGEEENAGAKPCRTHRCGGIRKTQRTKSEIESSYDSAIRRGGIQASGEMGSEEVPGSAGWENSK